MIVGPNGRDLLPCGSVYFNDFPVNAAQNSQLNATTALTPQNGTICGWIYFVTGFRASWVCTCIAAGASFGASICSGLTSGAGGAANQFGIFATAGAFIASPVLTLNTWYFFALTLGASTTTGMFRQRGTAFSTVTHASTTGLSAPFTHYLGNDGAFADGCPDAYYAGWKSWSRVLSQQELFAESNQLAPLSPVSLASYLPMRNLGSLATDEAQTGRVWTKTASFANALRSPPVPELANPKATVFLSSGGGLFASFPIDDRPPATWQAKPYASRLAGYDPDVWMARVVNTRRAYPSQVGLGGFLLFGADLQPLTSIGPYGDSDMVLRRWARPAVDDAFLATGARSAGWYADASSSPRAPARATDDAPPFAAPARSIGFVSLDVRQPAAARAPAARDEATISAAARSTGWLAESSTPRSPLTVRIDDAPTFDPTKPLGSFGAFFEPARQWVAPVYNPGDVAAVFDPTKPLASVGAASDDPRARVYPVPRSDDAHALDAVSATAVLRSLGAWSDNLRIWTAPYSRTGDVHVVFDVTRPLASVGAWGDELRAATRPAPRSDDAPTLAQTARSVGWASLVQPSPPSRAPRPDDAQSFSATRPLASFGAIFESARQWYVPTGRPDDTHVLDATRPLGSVGAFLDATRPPAPVPLRLDHDFLARVAAQATTSIGWVEGDGRSRPGRPARPDDAWQASDTRPLPTISWGEDTSTPRWQRSPTLRLIQHEGQPWNQLGTVNLPSGGYLNDEARGRWVRPFVEEATPPANAARPIARMSWVDEAPRARPTPARPADDATPSRLLAPGGIGWTSDDATAARYYRAAPAADAYLSARPASSAATLADAPAVGGPRATRTIDDATPLGSRTSGIGWLNVEPTTVRPRTFRISEDHYPPRRLGGGGTSLGWLEEPPARWRPGWHFDERPGWVWTRLINTVAPVVRYVVASNRPDIVLATGIPYAVVASTTRFTVVAAPVFSVVARNRPYIVVPNQ